jgi:hypothetical protein
VRVRRHHADDHLPARQRRPRKTASMERPSRPPPLGRCPAHLRRGRMAPPPRSLRSVSSGDPLRPARARYVMHLASSRHRRSTASRAPERRRTAGSR